MSERIKFEDIKAGDRIFTVTRDRDLLEYTVFKAHKFVRQDFLTPIEQWLTDKGVVGISRYADDPDFFRTEIHRLEAVENPLVLDTDPDNV